MADLIAMLSAAAGAAGGGGGNPNAWDISKAYYDAGADAGDLSKAFFFRTFGILAEDTAPTAVAFSTDGTTFYVAGDVNNTIYQYTCVSPWNIGTGTAYASKSFSVNSQETSPKGLAFKSDGTKMYVLGDSGNDVNEYSLSTAWDVSTSSYVQNFSVASQTTDPQGLAFSTDGTKMYVNSISVLYEYSLSSAWDVSSASYVQNKSVSAQDGSMQGVSFLGDGTKMYLCGSNGDAVYEYDLSTPWDISTATYVQSLAFVLGGSPVNPNNLFVQPDGSNIFVTTQDTGLGSVNQYPFGGFSVATQDTSPQGIFFKPDGTKMYIVGLTGDAVYEYNLSTDWDITTASYLQNFSVSSQETNPSDLFFKDDGTKMYIIGTTGDDVNEYSLSVAWDISSASYTTNFSVASQELGPNALFFKPDGTKMYIVGQGNDTIYQYGLSTAWDISSASYDSVSFSIAAQDGTPNGLSFKPDGTKMYVLGNTGDDVNEYNLSSAWDISSATFVQNTGVLDSSPSGLFWRDNGEEFFIVGAVADRVLKYAISST